MDSPDILEKTELPVDCGDSRSLLQFARENFRRGNFNKSFDIYEKLADLYPKQSVEILAEVYDCYQLLPNKDRYNLYQARSFEFNIKAADKVLDIGSGNIPFPYATHLADLTITDNNYGRAGVPFRHIEVKPVFECDIENMPFKDKEFDFVYCSHVLEHVVNPEHACEELMRVGKRGYIETPTGAKDLWLNTAEVSNHKWAVEIKNGILVFNEYKVEEKKGLGCNVLLEMHCAPQTMREKAFSALIYLKAKLFNTMLLWEDSFEYEVRRVSQNSGYSRRKNYREDNTLVKDVSDQPDIRQNHNQSEMSRPASFEKDKPLKIQVIGTEYGSSAVVLDLIPVGSTVISAGVGEDISFDLELIRLKQCRIIGIDPTEKAKRYIENNKNEHFHFLQKALYPESNKKIKIYKNTNPSYVSESVTPFHNMVSSSDFYEAETVSLPDLLREYRNISVLKMDIEGAEYEVINSINGLEIPQIYVEFHHFCTDFTVFDTERCIKHLNQMGYVIAYGKSNGGTLKDVTFVHRKYLAEQDILQISVDELGEVGTSISAAPTAHII